MLPAGHDFLPLLWPKGFRDQFSPWKRYVPDGEFGLEDEANKLIEAITISWKINIGDIDINKVRWAFAQAGSRAASAGGSNGDEEDSCLFPLFDLFNHHHNNKLSWKCFIQL